MEYDIAVFKGHGKYSGGFDPGAVYGDYREYDIVSKIVDEAVSLLKGAGLRVLTGENNYSNYLLSGHTITSKCAYSVHANKGKGRRTELLVPKGEKYFNTEEAIGNGMKALGMPDYQIKSRDYDTEAFINRTNGVALSGSDYYGEIRDAWKRGISLTIFETGFMDSSDLSIITSKYKEIAFLMASELAKLCGKTISKPVAPTTPKPPTEVSGGFYRVIVGSFAEKENAIAQQNKLKKAGFDSFLDFYKK